MEHSCDKCGWDGLGPYCPVQARRDEVHFLVFLGIFFVAFLMIILAWHAMVGTI